MTTEKERIEKIRVDFERTAKAMKESGWRVVDNPNFETLLVEDINDENSWYSFKYGERDVILKSKPEWLEMDIFDFILASAAQW